MAIVEVKRYRFGCDRCDAMGLVRETPEEAERAAVQRGWRAAPGGKRVCPACARAARGQRDVVAARADDGVAGGARGA